MYIFFWIIEKAILNGSCEAMEKTQNMNWTDLLLFNSEPIVLYTNLYHDPNHSQLFSVIGHNHYDQGCNSVVHTIWNKFSNTITKYDYQVNNLFNE